MAKIKVLGNCYETYLDLKESNIAGDVRVPLVEMIIDTKDITCIARIFGDTNYSYICSGVGEYIVSLDYNILTKHYIKDEKLYDYIEEESNIIISEDLDGDILFESIHSN